MGSSFKISCNPLYWGRLFSNPPKQQLFEHRKNGLTVGVDGRCGDRGFETATHILFTCFEIEFSPYSAKYTKK